MDISDSNCQFLSVTFCEILCMENPRLPKESQTVRSRPPVSLNRTLCPFVSLSHRIPYMSTHSHTRPSPIH